MPSSVSRQSSRALSDMSVEDMDVEDMDVASPRRAVSRSVSRFASPGRRSRATSPATGRGTRQAVPFMDPEADLREALQRVEQVKARAQPSPAPSPARRRERRPSRSAPRERSPSPVRRRPSAGGLAAPTATQPRQTPLQQTFLQVLKNQRVRRAILAFVVAGGWFGLVAPQFFGEPTNAAAPLAHAALCAAVSAFF